jgi:hypothetical protein
MPQIVRRNGAKVLNSATMLQEGARLGAADQVSTGSLSSLSVS